MVNFSIEVASRDDNGDVRSRLRSLFACDGPLMISKAEMIELIKQGEVQIKYTYLTNSGGKAEKLPDEEAVDFAHSDSGATRMFEQNFFIDRLHVTMGPVVMSHERRHHRKRTRFKKFEGCTDIRKTGNQIRIEPRETLSVNSNERITLGGTVGALVLPRLKLADSGLIYTPSYVDPYWDGILQAVIVNATDSPQELKLGEAIATCFFFKLTDDAGERTKIVSEFRRRSHHYGQNWKGILENDANPFPRFKQPPEKEQLTLLTEVLHNRVS